MYYSHNRIEAHWDFLSDLLLYSHFKMIISAHFSNLVWGTGIHPCLHKKLHLRLSLTFEADFMILWTLHNPSTPTLKAWSSTTFCVPSLPHYSITTTKTRCSQTGSYLAAKSEGGNQHLNGIGGWERHESWKKSNMLVNVKCNRYGLN